MSKLKFQPDSENQVSPFILDNLKPLSFRLDWDTNFKKKEIAQLLKLKSLIDELGEIEHTSDWDIGVIIQYWDHNEELQKIETEQGYDVIQIDGDDILIENESGLFPEEDEGISYLRLPIKMIHSIQYFR